MSIRGRFKRSIQRLFLGDLVIDPEEYIKKIVDVLEKEYPEYWKASNFNSKKDSFWNLTKSWSEIKDDDTYFIRDTFDEQFSPREVEEIIKDTDRFLCINYKEKSSCGYYNYAVISVLFRDKDIMLIPYRGDDKNRAIYVETEDEIKSILIDPVILSLEKSIA